MVSQILNCSIKGDLSSLTLHSTSFLGRKELSRISSEAKFADKVFQFKIFLDKGLWCIEGNPVATNLTAVNGVALRKGTQVLKSNDLIGLIGHKTNNQAMRIRFQCTYPKIVNITNQKNPSTKPITPKVVSSNSLDFSTLIVGLSPDERELQNIVVRGWKSFSKEINITEFVKRTNWSFDRICACAQSAIVHHPEIFYVSSKFELVVTSYHNGTIEKAVLNSFIYDFDVSEYYNRKRKFDAVVADAISSIHGITDDVEKALKLHDYLVRVCDYDLEAAKADEIKRDVHTAYGALVQGKGICEGYTLAYRHLLNVAGIVSDVAINDKHIWNYVRIGKNWYHVDVTFDDPIYLNSSQRCHPISHKNFLMSDARAKQTNHRTWDVHGLPPANDTYYDRIYRK